MQRKKLPNFLIVGAAKSGTTSLYHYLRQHPDVFMPDWKEPAFFAPPEAGGVTSQEAYEALFTPARDQKAIGEASVAYLFEESAPRKISQYLGNDVKIIVLLRNPVDMAYSNWGHQTREGYESLTFEQALWAETERLADKDFYKKNGTWVFNLAYRARAKYKPQIQNYLSVFPREQIKVYLYEEFFAEGLPLWEDLCRFLKIDPQFKPAISVYNKAGIPRSKLLQKLINRPHPLKSVLKKIIPQKVRLPLRNFISNLNRQNKATSRLDHETRLRIMRDFDEDIKWLEELLCRDLSKIWY